MTTVYNTLEVIHNSITTKPDLKALSQFYKQNGYKGKLNSDDIVFWLCAQSQTAYSDALHLKSFDSNSLDLNTDAKITGSVITDTVINEDKTILAAARVEQTQHYALIRGVWVKKACRRKGYGLKLMRTVVEHLQNSPLPAFCFAEHELARFYEASGFSAIARDPLSSDLSGSFSSPLSAPFSKPKTSGLPQPLRQRFARYQKKQPNLVMLALATR